MSKQKSNELEGRLAIDELNRKIDQLNQSMPILESLAKGSKELKDQVTNEITKYALSIRASRLDKTELNNFFDHPYHLFKQKGDNDNSWHLAIPRFIDAQFGWLEKVTESHNIFVVNPYVDWLGEIPEALKQKIGMKDPLDVYLDGNSLRGKDIEKIKMKMSPFITRAEKDRLIIDKSRHFELLAALIKENILPFVPKPVDQEDLYEKPRFKEDFELRDYHYEAWYTFKKYSNIGYFLPPSGGKTFLSMYALGYVKGPNLICVPSKQLKEQWIARIETYTTLRVSDEIKDDVDVVVMTYQSAIKKAHKIQWSLMVIDEVHHLPANLFSKLATLSRKYLIGLTATPQREDDREEYIFALTGKPCGLSWQKMKELGIIKNPDLHVWIVKNESERWDQLDNLMNNYPGQTIIFSDEIKKGEAAAKRYDLKFVHGSGKIGVKDIPKGESFVCSRVGDEGISLPQIKRVIEISWLHGSRRQELQRFTRILHGKNIDGVGHIIMTLDQYTTDRKRLFGIMEKGFKIVLHREGYSDKEIIEATYNKPKRNGNRKPRQSTSKVNSGPENSKSHLVDEVSKLNPVLQGAKKALLNNLNSNELECLRIMFANPHIKYTKEKLHGIIKKGRVRDFASFKKMETLGFITKVDKIEYQAKLD